MHRVIALLLGFLLLAGSEALAQTPDRIAGRVVDQTGAPLQTVSVDLVAQSAELTATTDAAGVYRFDSVPPGRVTLTFRLINFSVPRRSVSVPNGAAVAADGVLSLARAARRAVDVLEAAVRSPRTAGLLLSPASCVAGERSEPL